MEHSSSTGHHHFTYRPTYRLTPSEKPPAQVPLTSSSTYQNLKMAVSNPLDAIRGPSNSTALYDEQKKKEEKKKEEEKKEEEKKKEEERKKEEEESKSK